MSKTTDSGISVQDNWFWQKCPRQLIRTTTEICYKKIKLTRKKKFVLEGVQEECLRKIIFIIFKKYLFFKKAGISKATEGDQSSTNVSEMDHGSTNLSEMNHSSTNLFEMYQSFTNLSEMDHSSNNLSEMNRSFINLSEMDHGSTNLPWDEPQF